MKIAEVRHIEKPLNINVQVPGSKSYTLRAMFIAALCTRKFEIKNALESDDTRAMKNCLEALKEGKEKLDAGESGITLRFITALACLQDGAQTISGEPGLNKRPIKDLVVALRQLGAEIEYLENEGFSPIRVKSNALNGETVKISGQISSQYVSALLLIAPTLPNGLTIEIEDEQSSKSFIDMTLDIMGYFGVEVENQNYQKYVVKPQKYQAKDYEVEADYSSACYFFAINQLTGSKIQVENLNPSSRQADVNFVKILQSMDNLKPIEVNMNDCPDQAMTMAVLAAFAPGKSTISGIASLRVKETERIKALENELAKMGIVTESTEDSLTIFGGNPKPARIDSYGDHRIAMSFAVAAAKLAGMEILSPDVVRKTFPGFWEELRKITDVKIEEKEFSNIVLVGMRGAGKSTIAKILAQNLGKRFVELDDHIVASAGKAIPQIVKENSWEYFRGIETEAIKELTDDVNLVISTGGGAVLRTENVDILKKSSLTVFLKADLQVMADRTKDDINRPALTQQKSLIDEFKEVWAERKDKYYAAADFVIDTEGLLPDQVAEQIIAKIKQ